MKIEFVLRGKEEEEGTEFEILERWITGADGKIATRHSRRGGFQPLFFSVHSCIFPRSNDEFWFGREGEERMEGGTT